MSNDRKNSKIASSELKISAKAKSKIKTYVEHGFVMKNNEEYIPKNRTEAFSLLAPNCNRRIFNMYVHHVEAELVKLDK